MLKSLKLWCKSASKLPPTGVSLHLPTCDSRPWPSHAILVPLQFLPAVLQLIKAMLQHGLGNLAAHCPFVVSVPIKPMLPISGGTGVVGMGGRGRKLEGTNVNLPVDSSPHCGSLRRACTLTCCSPAVLPLHVFCHAPLSPSFPALVLQPQGWMRCSRSLQASSSHASTCMMESVLRST